jgi:hypothetical protein
VADNNGAGVPVPTGKGLLFLDPASQGEPGVKAHLWSSVAEAGTLGFGGEEYNGVVTASMVRLPSAAECGTLIVCIRDHRSLSEVGRFGGCYKLPPPGRAWHDRR